MLSTLNLKQKEKNQKHLLGIKLPKNLKINHISFKNNIITKFKIIGYFGTFILPIVNFVQVLYFLQFGIFSFLRFFETKFLYLWQEIYFVIFSNYIMDLHFKFKIYLRIIGIAYKVFYEDGKIPAIGLTLGFTHKIRKKLPSNTQLKILDKKSKRFVLISNIRQKVKEFIMAIFLLKHANIYTGKGLKFYNKKLKRKLGKKKFGQ